MIKEVFNPKPMESTIARVVPVYKLNIRNENYKSLAEKLHIANISNPTV